MVKEIVVISGKGGTGKTSLTASFAWLAAKNAIIADCDVDAADMHLLLKPDFKEEEEFYSGERAFIKKDQCICCGKCAEVCRYDAIKNTFNIYQVDVLLCEGCGYCSRICPTHAINNKKRLTGEWYISTIKTGSLMVHAKLGIGADNSGKLVAKLKNEARGIAEDESRGFVIVDGSPGIGCPVVSSLSGAHFVVMVTEPSVSGLHDLRRLYSVVKKFNLKAGCVINKFDINEQISNEIEIFLEQENILHLVNLPYDENFTKAMTAGQTIVEYTNGNLRELVEKCWNKIKYEIQ